MLGVMGSNPLRYLDGRRVCIADRLRAFEDMHLHHNAGDCEQQAGPASHGQQHMDWCSMRGVQLPAQGSDAPQLEHLLEHYMANLVLITSVSSNCICPVGKPSQRTKHSEGRHSMVSGSYVGMARRAVTCVDKLCQHNASKYVMAAQILPGLNYDAQCVVELSDTHGLGLTSAALAMALPLFCNLRRLNLSRNRLVTVCGMGLEGMNQLQVLDVSNNALRDRLQQMGSVFDALPNLVALMLRNNPCMRTRAERMRLMQTMTSLRSVSCTLRYLDSEITMHERVQAWAQASARSPTQLEELKQQALLILCAPPGLIPEHVLELDLSARSLAVLEGRLLQRFVSLRRLLLQDNKLTSLAATQLGKLTALQVLDLRRNALSDGDHLVRTVISLSNLQELGLTGNALRCTSTDSLPTPAAAAAGNAVVGAADDDDLKRILLARLACKYQQDARYSLRFLDDCQIAIKDIVRASAIGVGAGSKLAFELTVARQMQDCVALCLLPHDASLQQLVQLDLSDRELSYVDFSRMPLLTHLLLQHNRLNDNALLMGGLRHLSCLKHLDVSHNNIESFTQIGQIVASGHTTRSLHSVSLSNNPCFPSYNLHADRVAFLGSKPVMASLACPAATLQLLNHMPISVSERVDAVDFFLRSSQDAGHAAQTQSRASVWDTSMILSKLSGSLPAQQSLSGVQSVADEKGIADMVEDVRLTLLLEKHRCSYSSVVLSLSRQNLGNLRALCDYIYVAELDVRGNALACLEPLAALLRLARLDVRDNKVSSTHHALQALSKCDELRHVCVERMSCDWSAFAGGNGDDYHQASFTSSDSGADSSARKVFRRLPALLDCDGELNPAPLASFQWTALMHLKRVFGIGPNCIGHIDLSARNIQKEDFYRVRDWLAFLPVTDLNIDQNPLCINVQSYRYVLINDLRTLDQLNGCTITDAERANAFKKVEEMKRDLTYNPPNVESLKLDNVGRAYSKVTSRQGAGASANAMSMWGSQLESWIAFIQVQSFIGSFPDIPWDSLPLYKDIRDVLGPLSQNLDYILPDVQCMCFWGYVKSGALILTPIIAWRIFRLTIDWERWEHEIVHHFRPALLRKLAQWAAASFLSLLLALAIDCIDCSSLHAAQQVVAVNLVRRSVEQQNDAAILAMNATGNATDSGEGGESCSEFLDTGQCHDWKRLITLEGLSRPTMGWCVALLTLNTTCLLLWLSVTLLARYKNRKGHDAGFWFSFTGMIKKCGMVLISMSYLPICNILLDNVRPFEEAAASNSTQLKWGFPTGGCMVTDGSANALCPQYPVGFLWMADPQYIMFIVSSVFALLYMVGIPLYLMHHVREAVSVLDRNNPRHVRLFQEVHTLRHQRSWHARVLPSLLSSVPAFFMPLRAADEQKEKSMKRKRLLARANALYAEAVCDFDDARTALYCSYKWNHKYFKMVGISERVLILLLAFFLSDSSIKLWMGHDTFEALDLKHLQLHKMLTAATTAVFLAVSVLGQPFSDWQDGLIDGMCRFTNVCNAVVVFLASKPDILFAYAPFDATSSMLGCGNQTGNGTQSNVQQFGLTMAGMKSDASLANSNSTESGIVTLESLDVDEVPHENAGYCAFLHAAGYALGVLNILCFVLIFVGMLASPIRWWLHNRKAKRARSGEYELQEKCAMNRRRSSILGFSSHPRTVLHSFPAHTAAAAAARDDNTAQQPYATSASTVGAVQGEKPTLKNRVALLGLGGGKRQSTHGQSAAGPPRVSRSSRVSLGALTSNDVAARESGKGAAVVVEKKKKDALSRSKTNVLKVYQEFSDVFLG